MIHYTLLAVLLIHLSHGEYNGRNSVYNHVIYTDCDNGNDTDTCGTFQQPCKSVLKASTLLKDSSVILIPESTICRIDILVNISLLNRVGIIANKSCTLQCTNASYSHTIDGAGIYIAKVTALEFTNVSFHECGALLDSASRNASSVQPSVYKFRAAVYIVNTTNVTVHSAYFTGNRGVGLAMYYTNGSITISNSTFVANLVPHNEVEIYPGGGGMLIEYPYCSPGLIECQNTTDFNEESQIVVLGCKFIRNIANRVGMGKFFVMDAQSYSVSVGTGAGIGVVFGGNSFNNSMLIQGCDFQNNQSPYGGGISVLFVDHAIENNFTVLDTNMENNHGLHDGGALRIGIEFYDCSNCAFNNYMNITNVYFKSNAAQWGGGVEFYSSVRLTSDRNNYIYFRNCTWEGNIAKLAAAVDIVPNAFQSLQNGLYPTPVFEDCMFVENILHSDESGILNFHFSKIKFQNSVTFVNNTGTAIYSSDSTIIVLSNTTMYFINNTGVQGGAVALIGSSIIRMYPNVHLNFIQNTATEIGGAIFFYSRYPSLFYYSFSCLFQYFDNTLQPQLWNVTLNFDNNTATSGGHSIYATTIIPCARAASNGSNPTKELPIVLTSPPFHHTGHINKTILTYVAKLVYNPIDTASPDITVAPGQVFDTRIFSFDELNQSVEIPLQTLILPKASGASASIDTVYSFTSDRSMRLKGLPGEKVQLQLQTTGPRKLNMTLNITLVDCPPGYILQENTSHSVCICSAETDEYTYSGISRCISERFQAVLNDNYWAGCIQDRNNVFATGLCPVGFCGTPNDSSIILAPTCKDVDNQLCGSRHRTGVLCGKCKKNMAVYYHSTQYNCGNCEHSQYGILFYIISELVPLTLLFVLIIIFGISFTSGFANSFIFFAQVLNFFDVTSIGSIHLPRTLTYLTEVYQFIFGVFNLSFFKIERISFCLFRGSTVLDVLAFSYITALYALLMLFILILFLKFIPSCYSYLQRMVFLHSVRNSLIQAISALLILSYAQCAKVSFQILTAATLEREGLQEVKNYKVVYLSGEMSFFGQKHIPYAIPAVLVLLLMSIPPLLLIAYPALAKLWNLCSCHMCNREDRNCTDCCTPWFLRFVPFMDAFQGCYKDNCRYFAGLYFVYRLAFTMAFAFTDTVVSGYFCLEVIIIAILAIHALFQPYEKRYYNIIDTAIFANLALINGISLYNCYLVKFQGDDGTLVVTSSVQTLLVYLPILYISIMTLLKLMVRMNQSMAWIRRLNKYIPLIDKQLQEYSYSFNEERVPFRLFETSSASYGATNKK